MSSRTDTSATADLLGRAYARVTRAVEGLSPVQLLLGTRCRGWTVQDLLFHQLLDAQRALVAFATPVAEDPDVDAVTYWRPFRPGGEDDEQVAPAAHARFVRIAASAYADPCTLVSHWRTTSEAAVRAAAHADPVGRVATQGHVIAVPDLVSTLVVEATVHHLDLVVDLEAGPAGSATTTPDPEALALARRVLEGVHGEPLPAVWDDVTCVVKGTGRSPLTDADRAALGAGAGRLPLLG